MPGQDNLDAHFSRALDRRFKIVDLEPQQHPVSLWFGVRSGRDGVLLRSCATEESIGKTSCLYASPYDYSGAQHGATDRPVHLSWA